MSQRAENRPLKGEARLGIPRIKADPMIRMFGGPGTGSPLWVYRSGTPFLGGHPVPFYPGPCSPEIDYGERVLIGKGKQTYESAPRDKPSCGLLADFVVQPGTQSAWRKRFDVGADLRPRDAEVLQSHSLFGPAPGIDLSSSRSILGTSAGCKQKNGNRECVTFDSVIIGCVCILGEFDRFPFKPNPAKSPTRKAGS